MRIVNLGMTLVAIVERAASGQAAPRLVALYALYVVVGLPLHNLVMAELWELGVRGVALDVVSAWKEVLLAVALGVVVWRQRGTAVQAPTPTDWLALAVRGPRRPLRADPAGLARRRGLGARGRSSASGTT